MKEGNNVKFNWEFILQQDKISKISKNFLILILSNEF